MALLSVFQNQKRWQWDSRDGDDSWFHQPLLRCRNQGEEEEEGENLSSRGDVSCIDRLSERDMKAARHPNTKYSRYECYSEIAVPTL